MSRYRKPATALSLPGHHQLADAAQGAKRLLKRPPVCSLESDSQQLGAVPHACSRRITSSMLLQSEAKASLGVYLNGKSAYLA